MYFSRVNFVTLIVCLFHPCATAVARKRPWSFCQKWRWQVTSKHAYTIDPMKWEWAGYAAVLAYCGNLSRNKLTCNLSWNIWPRSSQLAEPLWSDPGIKSGISASANLTLNFFLKRQMGNAWSNILLTPWQVRKKQPPPCPCVCENVEHI